MPIGNPEHTVDGANRSANAGADRSADQPADRAGGPIAFVGTFLRAAHDALGVPGMRDRERRERDCR